MQSHYSPTVLKSNTIVLIAEPKIEETLKVIEIERINTLL